ncbi:DS13B phosphatase, partial [Polypterus senegalus]
MQIMRHGSSSKPAADRAKRRKKKKPKVFQRRDPVFLGYTARDKTELLSLGITHIVNAAHGRYHVNTGAGYYSDMHIDYYGVEADDDPEFDLSPYFHPTAKFIRAGLNSPKGKVLVHCAMGISRSAALVFAFLMICKKMTLVEAIKTVGRHRDVCPNSGFLSQLRQLDITLAFERKRREDHYRL